MTPPPETDLEHEPPREQSLLEAWLTPGRFALFLGLLVAAAFPGVLLGKTTFVIRDFGLFSYPVAAFQRDCFWRGELPLWDPYNYCGTPFLAQWNTLPLYPPALIYLLLPLTWSLPFFCLVHLFWGGLGMFFLARQWTNNCLAAGLAGVVFSFNGLALNFLMWPSHIATFSWLPWVVWLARSACSKGGRGLAWAVGAAILQMLAGAPETLLFTWFMLLLLAVGDALHRVAPARQILRRLLSIALMALLACAAQVLPFAELLAHSQRDSGFAAANWPMPLWGWANFLVPSFRTIPSPQGILQQPDQFWTSSYYAGLSTVLLALVAVRRARGWLVWPLAALSALSLMMALGDRGLLYHGLRLCVPAIGFARYPIKFVIVALALAPLLAAFGFAALTAKPWRPRRFAWGCAVLVVLVIGALVWADCRFPIVPGAGKTTAMNASMRLLFAGLAFGLIAAYAQAQSGRRCLLGSLVLMVCWFDLITHAPSQNPGVRPSVYSPGWALAQLQLEPQPRLGGPRLMASPGAMETMKYHAIPGLEENYLRNRVGCFADCNLLEPVPQAGGFFSLTPAEINNLTVLPYLQTSRDFPALLDLLGVSYINAPGKVLDWVRRPSAMPLVTAGQLPVFADGRIAFTAFFQTNIDFRKVVFLPPEARQTSRTARPGMARVLSASFTDQTASIETDAAAPSIVVVSQTWYPAWKARIDGLPTRLWRADYALQAVQVPSGRHTVRLWYEDTVFHTGAVLSALGILAWVGLWFHTRSRRFPRTNSRSSPEWRAE